MDLFFSLNIPQKKGIKVDFWNTFKLFLKFKAENAPIQFQFYTLVCANAHAYVYGSTDNCTKFRIQQILMTIVLKKLCPHDCSTSLSLVFA